jgi:hypothetical protein
VQLQGGVNLAQWLVNKPGEVEQELQSYSQEFLDFWKQQRADYWKKVAAAREAFDEAQKNSKGVSALALCCSGTFCHCSVDWMPSLLLVK